MPPKKKGNPIIDGVDTSGMSREQLEAFGHRLVAAMEREREERNFFQLERDKIRTFWEITRNQLDEANTALRDKDREMETIKEMAELDVKHTIQKMKHLQYESQTKVGEVRAETMAALKISQEEHSNQEQELLKDKNELRRQMKEKEELAELQIQQLKMHYSQILSEERQGFEAEAKNLTLLHERKLACQQKESDMKHRLEMFEVEERKNTQISKLIETHDKAFNEMKNYYNDITLNNLALISSLKEQMEELRKHSERQERIANETMAENKKLTEPLKEARAELADLRKKLEHYDRDRIQLAKTKIKYSSADKELNSLKWESEALNMRNETLRQERDKLKRKFEDALMELQQKTGLKNVLLEKKVTMLEEQAEKREAVLNEALKTSMIEPDNLNMRIEALLQSKNEIIEDLRYELARVCKAHDDLLATYEAKMVQFGIPKEELGFEPLRTSLQIKLGSGPAGLVTKNR